MSAFFKNRVCLISKIFQETHKTVSNSIFLALILTQFLNLTTGATLPTYEILIAVENHSLILKNVKNKKF
jgi:hypothetical protein